MPITVITAPESTDLTLLATVKDELGISGSGEDTIINRFIKVASNQITTYCGRNFAKSTVDETILHDGGYRIVLSNFPINSITSVKYKNVAVDTDYYIVADSQAGFLDYIGTDTARGSWEYTAGAYDYVIRYEYGYILPSFSTGTRNLPYDIEQAAIECVKQMYFDRAKDGSVAKETVPQVYEVTYASNVSGSDASSFKLPQKAEALLNPYKVYRI